MSENNPIEFKSDDPFAKMLLGTTGQSEEQSDDKGKEQSADEKKTDEVGDEQNQNQKKEEQKTEPIIDFNEILKEKTGGKFSSIEEIENYKPQAKKVEIPEFKDDLEKLVWAATQKNDFSKLSEIINLNTSKVDSISDIDAVREKLKAEMPGLTGADLEDELYERYGLGYKPLTDAEKDSMSDEQIANHEKDMRRFARQLKNDAEVKRGALKSEIENKKKELLDSYKDVFESKEEKPAEEKPKEQKEEKPAELSKDELEKIQRGFEMEVTKNVKEISNFKLTEKVQVSENEEIDVDVDYTLSEEESKKLADFIFDYELTPVEEAKYVKKNGAEVEVDLKGLIQDKAKVLFASQFQKVLVKEAVAKAKEHVIKKDLKRVNLTPESITNRDESISDRSKANADFMAQWANQINVQGT